ncbi:hypothetical protein GLAREA_11662 [Glarea lozoyensis ATCC 20868]|uniref:2EXR domain-containing protein n=1 Tax=Glarea lozoyensis (strain ATCC 20868 / MF5171) TaxID=1116229 RepID=S3CZ14_GLAL2|nr:uncharacterized protein GLAREA_11662 [Glarea lozoyensis ATCC 20868]EPE25081.1 hypothetical protein GLAREA_11662 [Glarea lozoyensis ATCC 20868]
MAISTLPSTTTTLTPTKPLSSTTQQPPYKRPTFPFLALPIELRLKIYHELLPPRTHTIVSDTRPSGLFFNSSPPSSTYPFGTPPAHPPKYRILTTNHHTSFPSASIYPQILRCSRQTHAEAESLLYGHKDAIFDFGTHSDALISFFSARSSVARSVVRHVRLGKEIHCVLSNEEGNTVFAGVDGRWVRLCEFVRREMTGLWGLELRVWGSHGGRLRIPTSERLAESEVAPLDVVALEREPNWHIHPWTSPLLTLPSLRTATITVWDFQIGGKEGEKRGFDSWLAERMVVDEVTRDRMVREGLVVEGVVKVRGEGY